FVDALGAGDLDTAADLLGPRSEEYVVATAGSVARFFSSGVTEGYGAWATSTDRTARVVDVNPDPEVEDLVVVLRGNRMPDGTPEARVDAFPVVYAESAKTWFVDLWAFDPDVGGRIELVTPRLDDDGR